MSGCGISQEIAALLLNHGLDCRVHPIDLGSRFAPHGDLYHLNRHVGLDAHCIKDKIREVMRHEN